MFILHSLPYSNAAIVTGGGGTLANYLGESSEEMHGTNLHSQNSHVHNHHHQQHHNLRHAHHLGAGNINDVVTGNDGK